jgi:hypothetical protein
LTPGGQGPRYRAEADRGHQNIGRRWRNQVTMFCFYGCMTDEEKGLMAATTTVNVNTLLVSVTDNEKILKKSIGVMTGANSFLCLCQ